MYIYHPLPCSPPQITTRVAVTPTLHRQPNLPLRVEVPEQLIADGLERAAVHVVLPPFPQHVRQPHAQQPQLPLHLPGPQDLAGNRGDVSQGCQRFRLGNLKRTTRGGGVGGDLWCKTCGYVMGTTKNEFRKRVVIDPVKPACNAGNVLAQLQNSAMVCNQLKAVQEVVSGRWITQHTNMSHTAVAQYF